MAKRICIGAIAGAHGVRGDFKVKSFTANPEDVAAYGPVSAEKADRTFSLKLLRQAKPSLFIARAPEVSTREQAEELKGTRLYVDRACLPPPDEDEFYYEDLVGLGVRTQDGQPFGRVKAVLNHGAGDMLELAGIPGVKGTRIVPFTKEAVPEIDFDAGLMSVALPADFLDEPPEEKPRS